MMPKINRLSSSLVKYSVSLAVLVLAIGPKGAPSRDFIDRSIESSYKDALRATSALSSLKKQQRTLSREPSNPYIEELQNLERSAHIGIYALMGYALNSTVALDLRIKGTVKAGLVCRMPSSPNTCFDASYQFALLNEMKPNEYRFSTLFDSLTGYRFQRALEIEIRSPHQRKFSTMK